MIPRSGEKQRARPLGEILRAMLGRKRFRQKGRYSAFVAAWQEVAGQAIAERSRVRVFKDGQLVVEVDSSALLHELNGFLKQDLLAGIQSTKAGREVVELRLCLASGTQPQDPIGRS